MRSTITAAHKKHYDDHGFVMVDNLLDAAEIAELKAAVARGVASMGNKKVNQGNDWSDGGDTYYDRVFLQRINLWKTESTVKRYMLGPELGTITAELAGARMRVWHDQTLQKAPWANPTAWHLDNPYWSFHSPNAISVWIALDDATLENGCMHYLPGSHRMVSFENVGIGADMGALFEVYPNLKNIDAVAVPMKAGSCAFHHGLTSHGAGPNMTPRWRRAMTCAYMPNDAVYNGQSNILTAERAASLKVGDSLNDEIENPLLPVFEHALT